MGGEGRFPAAGVYGAYLLAVGLRVVLLLNDNASEAVSARVEGKGGQVSTPVTSFKRAKEGAFLWDHGASPYSGDALHMPPLMLLLLHPVVQGGAVFRAVAFGGLSGVCALLLRNVGIEYLRSEEARPSCSFRGKLSKFKVPTSQSDMDAADARSDEAWLPHALALAYLLHPFSILTSVGMSSLAVDHTVIVLGLLLAQRGQMFLGTLCLAFAAHVCPYTAVLLPAFVLVLEKRAGWSYVSTVGCFGLWVGVLLSVSWWVCGSWDFLQAVYGFVVTVPDLIPNVGLFWYFFMEIFDHFKSFFLFIFQYHIAVYPIPLAMRLSHRPVYLALCLLSITAIFKSYPSVGDSALCHAIYPLFYRQLAGMRHMFLLCNVLLFVTVLAPIFWHTWIVTGSGNSNFYYALTLAFAAAQVLLLSESMLAVFRFDRARRRQALDEQEAKAMKRG